MQVRAEGGCVCRGGMCRSQSCFGSAAAGQEFAQWQAIRSISVFGDLPEIPEGYLLLKGQVLSIFRVLSILNVIQTLLLEVSEMTR